MILACTTSSQLSVRLHYKEIDILLNGGISFDFNYWWLYSFIYVYFQVVIFILIKNYVRLTQQKFPS